MDARTCGKGILRTQVSRSGILSTIYISIQSVSIDGKPLETSYITHRQLMSGATLVFEMGNKPGPVWYKK
ncbi:glycoside hydrolase domain-containing protein [Sphingobacterium sp. JUb78]|uniref:glycoside hydrolase domain-containing protein n=1 Tax=Sphingobacterium sp. JUb78 TaxID=2485111 RepID=UPI00104BC145